jgi:hypothetical protein
MDLGMTIAVRKYECSRHFGSRKEGQFYLGDEHGSCSKENVVFRSKTLDVINTIPQYAII